MTVKELFDEIFSSGIPIKEYDETEIVVRVIGRASQDLCVKDAVAGPCAAIDGSPKNALIIFLTDGETK